MAGVVGRLLERALQGVDGRADDQQIVVVVALAGASGDRHRSRPAAQQTGRLGLGGAQRRTGVLFVVGPVATRGERALAVAEPRHQVGLVDRHPAGHEVADGLGHPVDVPGPHEYGLVVEPAPLVVGEPPGRGAVQQADPHVDAGVVGGGEDSAEVGDLVVVPPAGVGLEPGPLDGEPVVPDAVLGEQPEVVGVAGAEPVAVAGCGRPTLGLPSRPVRPGRGALALRGRRRGAPPRAIVIAVRRGRLRGGGGVGGVGLHLPLSSALSRTCENIRSGHDGPHRVEGWSDGAGAVVAAADVALGGGG